jgi:hypothetical protein
VIGAWERPPHQPNGGARRVLEVMDAVDDAMETTDVVELAPDPPGWHRAGRGVGGEVRRVVVRFETNQPARMGPACDEFEQALRDGAFTHDGDQALALHVSHCVPLDVMVAFA